MRRTCSIVRRTRDVHGVPHVSHESRFWLVTLDTLTKLRSFDVTYELQHQVEHKESSVILVELIQKLSIIAGAFPLANKVWQYHPSAPPLARLRLATAITRMESEEGACLSCETLKQGTLNYRQTPKDHGQKGFQGRPCHARKGFCSCRTAAARALLRARHACG